MLRCISRSMTLKTPLGSDQPFSEVLFLGIVYQPGQLVLCVPVNLQMHHESSFLVLSLCFPANPPGLQDVCSIPSWFGWYSHLALLGWSMDIKCRIDFCMSFWNVQVLICLYFLYMIIFSCSKCHSYMLQLLH